MRLNLSLYGSFSSVNLFGRTGKKFVSYEEAEKWDITVFLMRSRPVSLMFIRIGLVKASHICLLAYIAILSSLLNYMATIANIVVATNPLSAIKDIHI